MNNPLERISELHIMILNLYNGQYLKEQILPHLEKIKPDVFMAQELWDSHRERIRNALGSRDEYYSMLCPLSLTGQPPIEPWGIAIFSRLGLIEPRDYYYKGDPRIFKPNLDNSPADHRSMITAEVIQGGITYRVATTHFTHSFSAEVTEEQRIDFKTLRSLLETMPELILGGDINTPRGHEIFDTLATMSLTVYLLQNTIEPTG